MNKKHIVTLLQEWIDNDQPIDELSDKTHTRYRHFAKQDAKRNDDDAEFTIHNTGDETAGDEFKAKRDKREKGLSRSEKLAKKQGKLKSKVIPQQSLSQRIKKSMGFLG